MDLGGLLVRVFDVRVPNLVFTSDEFDCAFLAATALFEVLDVVRWTFEGFLIARMDLTKLFLKGF